MSMVARTNPGPAEDDITDTDDGDTRISAGAFWPDIVLRELRLAIRLPGRVTTSRLLHTATGAVAHVTRELEAWQQEQQAAGHQTLADVPAPARCTCCLISPGHFPLTAGIATGRKRQSDR